MAIQANFSYDSFPELSTRVLEKLVRESLEEAIEHWRKELEPKHFTNSATGAYQYDKRGKIYQIKKSKKTRQTAPLVYTGNSKRMALESNKITKRGNQVTLSISVPDYWKHLRLKRPNKDRGTDAAPNMQAELTRLPDAEKALIIKKMEERLQQKINTKLKR
ncbi:MAG: hypothetical protein WCL60_01340 [Methylococcales bacterium]